MISHAENRPLSHLKNCRCVLNKANQTTFILPTAEPADIKPKRGQAQPSKLKPTCPSLSGALGLSRPACLPALPHHIEAPCLIFHHHFEPEASLAEQALQTAGLVALLTT